MANSKESSIQNDYKTMQDIVFNNLMENILSGKLEPGMKLNINQISIEMGVSRTPVREAVKQLMSVGLVENTPHRSPFVKKLSIDEVIVLYYIRAALGGIAARLATKKLTKHQIHKLLHLAEKMGKQIKKNQHDAVLETNFEFHKIIYEATGSAVLQNLIMQYYRQCEQFRALVFELPGRYDEIAMEHLNIARALEKGDMEEAENMAREHHFNSVRRIAQSVGSDVEI